MTDPTPARQGAVTVLLWDLVDYLEQNGLEIVPGSLRWEPDPKRPGLERPAVDVRPISK